MNNRIVIVVKGGIVTDVYSGYDEEFNVDVIDLDVDPELDPEEYEEVQTAMKGLQYLIDVGDVVSVY